MVTGVVIQEEDADHHLMHRARSTAQDQERSEAIGIAAAPQLVPSVGAWIRS